MFGEVLVTFRQWLALHAELFRITRMSARDRCEVWAYGGLELWFLVEELADYDRLIVPLDQLANGAAPSWVRELLEGYNDYTNPRGFAVPQRRVEVVLEE